MAKYSDDDGYTWIPCKDASITKIPRPFYKPDLGDLQKHPEERKPPEQILLWPGMPIVGSLLVPFKGSVAAVSAGGGAWQVHDGERWGNIEKISFSKLSSGTVSEAIVGEDHLFLARGGSFSNLGNENLAGLECMEYTNGVWNKHELEKENVADVILTSSGDAVFCFYVKKNGEKYEVRYRRWKSGTWEDSKLIAIENFRINHVAAPQKCPPDYAAVWWDEFKTEKRGKPTKLRFAGIPNK